jgi:hypothetical protein
METKKHIDKYVSLMYNTPMDRVALCLIQGQAVQHRFTAVKDIGRFIPFLQAMNCQGWNIYITPSVMKTGALRRTKANFMSEQDVIYLDADDKQVMEKVRSEYPYPTLVVKTSVGHYQIYWKLAEKVSIEAQESLMKRIAQSVGSDIAATDVSRVLRLPGFWNKKPGKDNSVEVVFSRNERTPYKRFLEVATLSPLQSVSTNVVSHSQGARVQRRDRYISDITGRDGEKFVFPSKSEEDWYLVNEWLRQGIDRDECIERIKIRRAGEKKNINYYAKKTLENALKKLDGKVEI